jgi:hypothetical protein
MTNDIIQDAKRYRLLVSLLQKSYDREMPDVEFSPLRVYCDMVAAYKTVRTVKAELFWQDVRDEDLQLDSALDAMMNQSDN